MEHRRLGRLDRENSVLIFGGAALAEATEEDSDAAIDQALDAGVDHFDTAADYGDSELKYGRWMPEIRDHIFLSTKTGLREKDAAKRQIQDSLERLRVDNVDLLQLHSVGYRADYEALVEEVRRQDAGLMIIKTISRRNWPEGDATGDQRYTTWYEPFDRQEYIDAAVSWVLSHDELTGLAMVGDVTLVPMMLEAEIRRMSREEAEQVLTRASDYSSPFISIPF